MTDKNTDVEWLREQLDSSTEWVCGERRLFARLLAHIDQLEAENARLIEVVEDKFDINVRPTIHEIAAQMMAGMLTNPINDRAEVYDIAEAAYIAAEALAAEGRRRDGQA